MIDMSDSIPKYCPKPMMDTRMLTPKLKDKAHIQSFAVRKTEVIIIENASQCVRSIRPCIRSYVDQKLTFRLTPNMDDIVAIKIYIERAINTGLFLGLKSFDKITTGTHKMMANSINIREKIALPTTNGK